MRKRERRASPQKDSGAGFANSNPSERILCFHLSNARTANRNKTLFLRQVNTCVWYADFPGHPRTQPGPPREHPGCARLLLGTLCSSHPSPPPHFPRSSSLSPTQTKPYPNFFACKLKSGDWRDGGLVVAERTCLARPSAPEWRRECAGTAAKRESEKKRRGGNF